MSEFKRLTAVEILNIIEKSDASVSDFGYDEIDYKELGLGEVEEVEQVGGEGQGDHWHSVKYFKNHDVYIKVIGFYSSYNGTDFDYGYGKEVKPQEKTITVFE